MYYIHIHTHTHTYCVVQLCTRSCLSALHKFYHLIFTTPSWWRNWGREPVHTTDIHTNLSLFESKLMLFTDIHHLIKYSCSVLKGKSPCWEETYCALLDFISFREMKPQFLISLLLTPPLYPWLWLWARLSAKALSSWLGFPKHSSVWLRLWKCFISSWGMRKHEYIQILQEIKKNWKCKLWSLRYKSSLQVIL